MPANQLSFRVEIRVTPREGIVDPEGQTIARALEDDAVYGHGARKKR